MTNAMLGAGLQDGLFPIALFGHAARIVYEGSRIARDTHFGVPTLARLLSERHSDEIERSRLATKLLDDKSLSLADLKAEMAATYAVHHEQFTGNAVWFARPLETDMGVATYNDRIVAASIPLDRRFGLKSTDGSSIRAMAESMGGALAALSAMTGEPVVSSAPVEYGTLGYVKWRDRLTSRYLKRRYESDMAIETKLILLLVESEIATSIEILPKLAGGHELAVFRAQVVALFHSLSALRTIVQKEPTGSSSSRAVQRYLSSTDAQYILGDSGFRMVRNYAMHYGIRDPAFTLKLDAPMFGLVEYLTGRPISDIASFVVESTRTIADLMRQWRSP